MNSLVWSVGGVIAAVGVGWTAARLHLEGIAPVGLVSLGAGVCLGIVLSWLGATFDVTSRAMRCVAVCLLALVAVFAEHAWLYRDFRQEWHEARANDPRVAMFRPSEPWSPAEYFGRELTPARAVLWGFDAALWMTGAVIAAAVGDRRRGRCRVGADANRLTPEP